MWIWDGAGVGWMHEEGRLIGCGGSLRGGLVCGVHVGWEEMRARKGGIVDA